MVKKRYYENEDLDLVILHSYAIPNVKNGFYGNKDLGLVILHSYTILNIFFLEHFSVITKQFTETHYNQQP